MKGELKYGIFIYWNIIQESKQIAYGPMQQQCFSNTILCRKKAIPKDYILRNTILKIKLKPSKTNKKYFFYIGKHEIAEYRFQDCIVLGGKQKDELGEDQTARADVGFIHHGRLL